MIVSGAPITVDRDNDKDSVVALREIASEKVRPDDLKEELIDSLQKHVEVDEPEADAVPMLPGPQLGAESPDAEVKFDRMSEEELLRGLDGLMPPPKRSDDDAY